MLNWATVFFNSLWIFGCALLLAQFSINRYEKSQLALATPSQNQLVVSTIAYLLIGIGLVVVNQQLWQKALWILVTGLLLTNNYLSFRSADRK